MSENAKKIKIITIDEINRKAADAQSFIRACEDVYTQKINDTASAIAQNISEKPILLLSGPSGSGKTTTANRIAAFLRNTGIKTLVISMDDYFVPGVIPPGPDGKVDYERPERVDIKLLSEHLELLAAGKEITLPKFDFTDNSRHMGETIKRDKNTAVIIEGIHALNPEVTGGHHSYSSFAYVSVRTRIADSKGELLHPSKIRLLRRLSRDKLFRGRDYHQTVEKFGSVQRGESLYIMPYKSLADYDIDTFFAYELSVYKKVLPTLCSDFDDCEKRADMYSVLPRFLKLVNAIDTEDIPNNSMVREFIG